MFERRNGGFRLFRLFGIDVWLHWMWFLAAAYGLDQRKGIYTSPVWAVAEYLSLFCIVLMHEFGHALACRQTGGRAEQIMLWPLGGVAYVQPPPRPGAMLWSLAAGPLVNVALIPVFLVAGKVAVAAGLYDTNPDFYRFLHTLKFINLVLLCFNMLPIYPLDGGQILRALLWFVIGPLRSLYVALVIGMLGGLAGVGLAFYRRDFWTGLLACFVLSRCWQSFQRARMISRMHRQAAAGTGTQP
jgi:Zn-dependent protease